MTFLLYSGLYLGIGYGVYRLNRDYICDSVFKTLNVALLVQSFLSTSIYMGSVIALVILFWPLFLLILAIDSVLKEL